MVSINIKFSNRFLYTFIAVVVIMLFGMGVYAYGGTYGNSSIMGHSADEIGNGTIANTLTVSNGKVGIGTTTPGTNLEISSTASPGNLLRLSRSNLARTADIGIDDWGNLLLDNTIKIQNDAVGIGISWSSPGVGKLEVETDSSYGDSVGVKIDHIGTSSVGTTYGLTSEASGASLNNVAGYFSASGGTNNYGLIVENGDVGIGTTSPQAKLDVNGNIKLAISTESIGSVYKQYTPKIKVYDTCGDNEGEIRIKMGFNVNAELCWCAGVNRPDGLIQIRWSCLDE
ncbi:MAG TPA: hypothetical protein ENG87_04415 [Candidatus Pacearchaeota archaeon]|nr:hypothetical protein [Candidatus Pacearchaeota archaeon]